MDWSVTVATSFMFCYENSDFISVIVGDIGQVNNTSISRYKGDWFTSSSVSICSVLRKTLFALLQSTELTNEYHDEYGNILMKVVCYVP